jgi:hypothetical protein
VPDVVGIFALMGGVGLLVLGLVQSNQWGWSSGAVVASIAAGVLLVALLLYRCGLTRCRSSISRSSRAATYTFGTSRC